MTHVCVINFGNFGCFCFCLASMEDDLEEDFDDYGHSEPITKPVSEVLFFKPKEMKKSTRDRDHEKFF